NFGDCIMFCHGISRFSAVSLLVLGLCLSIASAGDDKKETVVTDKQDKMTVKVSKGTIVAIKLVSKPTTGFSWDVDKNNKDVLMFSGKKEFEKPNPPLPGAPSVQVMRFTAKDKGTSDVELIYHRPFEKDVPPAKTFKVKIEVTD